MSDRLSHFSVEFGVSQIRLFRTQLRRNILKPSPIALGELARILLRPNPSTATGADVAAHPRRDGLVETTALVVSEDVKKQESRMCSVNKSVDPPGRPSVRPCVAAHSLPPPIPPSKGIRALTIDSGGSPERFEFRRKTFACGRGGSTVDQFPLRAFPRSEQDGRQHPAERRRGVFLDLAFQLLNGGDQLRKLARRKTLQRPMVFWFFRHRN